MKSDVQIRRDVVEELDWEPADTTRMRQFAAHLHLSHHRDPDEPSMVVYSVDVTADLPPLAPLPPWPLSPRISGGIAPGLASHCQPNRRT